MSNAYIVKHGVLVAEIQTELRNGTVVRYAFNKAKNALDANREYDLVNAHSGMISRAKKYYKQALENTTFGTEINPEEFYLS